MATSLDNVNEDVMFYNVLKRYTRDVIGFDDKRNIKMVMNGIIQIDALLELAISNVANIKRTPVHGKDFSDDSDSKKVTSNWRNNDIKRGSWTNSYSIKNIHTKVGTLRVMAYNRVKNCFDYYRIPREAYSHLNSKSLDITLDAFVGCYEEPTPIGGSTKTKWNAYKVSSFEAMAIDSMPYILEGNLRKYFLNYHFKKAA
jgi:hypothetical protein